MNDQSTKARVSRIVWQTSFLSAALGAVLSPIPFADEIVLVPVYGIMASRIGKAHGLGITEVPWRPMFKAISAGLATRAALSVVVAMIPGVAAVANAVSATVLTRTLGSYANKACGEGAGARVTGAATA